MILFNQSHHQLSFKLYTNNARIIFLGLFNFKIWSLSKPFYGGKHKSPIKFILVFFEGKKQCSYLFSYLIVQMDYFYDFICVPFIVKQMLVS